MKFVAAVSLVVLLAVSAQAQTFTVSVFPVGTTPAQVPTAVPLRTYPLVDNVDAFCPGVGGMTLIGMPTNPQVLEWEVNGENCIALLEGVLLSLDSGAYVLAIQNLFSDEWYGPSLPFRRYPAPKECWDFATRYQHGTGPPVERYDNTTIAKRAIWLARERALVAAGFDVQALLVSTSVYFAVTCR